MLSYMQSRYETMSYSDGMQAELYYKSTLLIVRDACSFINFAIFSFGRSRLSELVIDGMITIVFYLE